MSDRAILSQLIVTLGISAKRFFYDEQDRLIRLDFSGSGITRLPPGIGQLTNLQRLDLDDNLITQIPEELGQLVNLRMLYLNDNQLTRVPKELGQLLNLQGLALHNNQLTKIPKELGQLVNLQSLALHNNKLAMIPGELGQLARLEMLSLQDNLLTQIPGELGKLVHLQQLYLSQNKLTEIPPEIGHLTNLHELNLNGNQLTLLPGELGQLINLQDLYLHDNQLTQIPQELDQLVNLQVLSLYNNRLIRVSKKLGQLAHLQILRLDENPHLLMPPSEIVNKGTEEILAFLRECLRGSVDRYEAKLLLVGEGGTGKSSLLAALQGRAFESDRETTRGIEVDVNCLSLPHPDIPGQALMLNTWDFGGQAIYHATHQFFLTKRSLYVIAWNARLGAMQGKLDYWLDTIRVLASDVPVLLVATHIDERTPDLNVQQYCAAYPQIVDALSISSKSGEGIAALKEALAKYAATLPVVGQPWPLSWVKVEQALLEHTEYYIDDDDYLGLCSSEDIYADVAQGTLGGYLHDLGKMLYYRDDPVLQSIVILKPNWITKAISRVLEDKKTEKASGILEHADLARIWSVDQEGRPYERSLYPIFLRLMERFDLSYQIDPMTPGMHPTQSLIPQLLPHNEPPEVRQLWPPDSTIPGLVHVEMVYRFDFVPAGIMSWFIVRTHRYTQNLHWRDGAILAYGGNLARVELFKMLRELRITVWGIEPHTFFVILKETLDLILTRFEGLQIRREVPCICQQQTHAEKPCHEVYRYKEDLVRRFEHKKQMIECPASFEEVSVVELLYGIHIGTTPQVLANVEAGNREILRRLTSLQQQDELLLQKVSQLGEWTVRSFTRQWNLEMQQLEAECPNTFFLIPDRRTAFNPKQWIGHKYTMFLVCQHPPGPHIVEAESGYILEAPREWWTKVAPWLKYLITFLKYGVPLADALGAVVDAIDFTSIGNQLKLLEQITSDLPGIVVESDPLGKGEKDKSTGREQATGPALRVLHSFLDKVDQEHYWSGLKRVVTPDGNILWLCAEHARPYEVQRLHMP